MKNKADHIEAYGQIVTKSPKENNKPSFQNQ